MDYGRYNTAVKGRRDRERSAPPDDAGAPPAITAKTDEHGITSLVHDICNGAHRSFRGAGCMYTEMAWKSGYRRFTEGTEAEGTSHGDYMAGILSCVYELRIPALIVCGKTEARKLGPEGSKEIWFAYHRYPAMLCWWFMEEGLMDAVGSDIQAKEALIGRYGNPLDPCCGYGNTARTAVSMGTGGIMSDISPECIAYIQEGRYLDEA